MFRAEKREMQQRPLVTEYVLTFICAAIGWIYFPAVVLCTACDWSDL
jgi:hypothetical protein